MRAIGVANDVLRFVLELVFLGVAFWFGARLGGNAITGLAGGVFLVLVAGIAWGAFAAPRRRFATPEWVPHAMFLGYGALAALALASGGATKPAVLLLVLVVANEGARLAGLQGFEQPEPRR